MAKKDEEKQKSLAEIKTENQNLYTQLTNKNEDYIFQLSNRLDELEYDAEKKEYVLNEMLQEIITAQEKSIPARRIYGTVTEQADNIVQGKSTLLGEGELERSPTWMIYMDGALLLGGLFAIINGIGAIRGGLENQVGLMQVLLNFLLGGFAVLVLTQYAPAPGQTKGLLRYVIATVIVMFAWVFLIYGILFIMPPAFNPWIPGQIVLGIGVVSLVAKWYLKRRLNIKGTLI